MEQPGSFQATRATVLHQRFFRFAKPALTSPPALYIHPCRLGCVIPDAYSPERSPVVLAGACRSSRLLPQGRIGIDGFRATRAGDFSPFLRMARVGTW